MKKLVHKGRVYRVVQTVPPMHETATGQVMAAKPLSPQEQAEYRKALAR